MIKLLISVFLIFISAVEVNADDTFLIFDSHHLQPQTKVSVSLINGTFEKSENSVALDRMQDVRITGPKQHSEKPEKRQWHLTKSQNELRFQTEDAGTYIVGVPIKPRTLQMTAEKFNSYLEHDGVLDIFEARQKSDQLDRNVTEKYSKHVKALFQVGNERTESFGQVFGYPIEIIPQQNPFSLSVGDTLPVKVLFHGKAVTNQLVYASYADFHRLDDDGHHIEAVHTRTNDQGLAQIKIVHKGRWYVRLIYMTTSDQEDVDYESNWATLTFEIK